MPRAYDRRQPPDDKNPLRGLLDFSDISKTVADFGKTPLNGLGQVNPIDRLNNLNNIFGPVDLNDAALDAQQAVNQFITDVLNPPNLLQAILDPNSPLNAANLFGQLPEWLRTGVPVQALGNFTPNLLANPLLEVSGALDQVEGWSWDQAVRHVGTGGSATVLGDGVQHELLSTPAAIVSPGQVLDVSQWLRYAGVTSTGLAFALGLNVYDNYQGTGTPIAQPSIAAVYDVNGNSTSVDPADLNFVQLAGSYTVPAGARSVRTRFVQTATVTAGQSWWHDGKLSPTQLLDQSLVKDLSTDLADKVLHGDFQGLMDTIADASAASLAQIQARLQALTTGGLFDAGWLHNMTAIPPVPNASVPGLTDVADFIHQALVNPAQSGNPLTVIRDNLAALVDNLRQGADGTPSTGGVIGDLFNALTGLRQTVASNNSAIVQIQNVLPGSAPGATTTVQGSKFDDRFDRAAGAGFNSPDWSSFGSGGVQTDGNYLSWADSGNVGRSQYGIYTAGEITSDYMSVKDVMPAVMESPEAWTGAGPSAGNGLLGRANSTGTRFVALLRWYNGIQLFDYNNGTWTQIGQTFNMTPIAGANWELECGNSANGLRHFTAYMNSKVVGSWDDANNITAMGAGFRMGGEYMQSDARGSTESTPGKIDLFSVSDKIPPGSGTPVGSGCQLSRITTTAISLGSGTGNLPGSVFDTVSNQTPDITPNTSGNRFTVSIEGWYLLSWNLTFSATATSHGRGILYRGRAGQTNTMEGYVGNWANGAIGGSGMMPVYMFAGDFVQLGKDSSASVSVVGDAGGTGSWFRIALLNRSTL